MTTIRNDTKIVKITDVSSEDRETVTSDYSDSGAEVTTSRQSDGKWTIEASFPVGAKYPASKRSLW